MSRRLKILLAVLLAAILGLWAWGPYRTIETPADLFSAVVHGERVFFDASLVRQAVLAGDSIEVVIEGGVVVWSGSAADFMKIVDDSVAHASVGEH